MSQPQTLRIETGEIVLHVNDDPTREITFNPTDVLFMERFQNLYEEVIREIEGYRVRAQELDADQRKDAIGMPVNSAERIKYVKELCAMMREKIDQLFGQDTSQKAFGDTHKIEVFEQFFDAITPYVEKARKERVKRYIPSKQSEEVARMRAKQKGRKK